MVNGVDALVFKRYAIQILRLIGEKPKRFSELRKEIRNKRTLSSRISELLEFGLVEIIPVRVGQKYANYYKLTTKGKEIIKLLKRIT